MTVMTYMTDDLGVRKTSFTI